MKPAVANDVAVAEGTSMSAAASTMSVTNEAAVPGGGVGGIATKDAIVGAGDVDATLEVVVGTN